MTTALSSPLNPADTAQAPILPGSAETKTSDARTAATDFLQIESIVLNLDASLRVHARAHFFSWTQGLLQSLIRHELLICTLLLVHGIHDAEGRAISLFIFACRPGSAGQRQAYLVQLLAPSLHAAWVRTQLTKRAESGGDKAAGGSVLTVRELDILKWIYLGKSNFEIGAILKISPLTVKNHVQKILRKLNVVNRTQAIGKSLELRILNP